MKRYIKPETKAFVVETSQLLEGSPWEETVNGPVGADDLTIGARRRNNLPLIDDEEY